MIHNKESLDTANDLALAQPPREAPGDSQNNEIGASSETEKEGGCCQQRLVLPWECAEFAAFMPMGWDSHLYVQWLAKTNNQPSVDSMCIYLANLVEICTVIQGYLPYSAIEYHYLRVARHLHSRASQSVPEQLMRELVKSPMKSLVEASLSGRHKDIDTVAVRIAQNTLQQYEEQRKVRIPYRPNPLCPEMDIVEVPVSRQVSRQALGPSENKCFSLVADVNREFLEQSLRELWERQNDTAQAPPAQENNETSPASAGGCLPRPCSPGKIVWAGEEFDTDNLRMDLLMEASGQKMIPKGWRRITEAIWVLLGKRMVQQPPRALRQKLERLQRKQRQNSLIPYLGAQSLENNLVECQRR